MIFNIYIFQTGRVHECHNEIRANGAKLIKHENPKFATNIFYFQTTHRCVSLHTITYCITMQINHKIRVYDIAYIDHLPACQIWWGHTHVACAWKRLTNPRAIRCHGGGCIIFINLVKWVYLIFQFNFLFKYHV